MNIIILASYHNYGIVKAYNIHANIYIYFRIICLDIVTSDTCSLRFVPVSKKCGKTDWSLISRADSTWYYNSQSSLKFF